MAGRPDPRRGPAHDASVIELDGVTRRLQEILHGARMQHIVGEAPVRCGDVELLAELRRLEVDVVEPEPGLHLVEERLAADMERTQTVGRVDDDTGEPMVVGRTAPLGVRRLGRVVVVEQDHVPPLPRPGHDVVRIPPGPLAEAREGGVALLEVGRSPLVQRKAARRRVRAQLLEALLFGLVCDDPDDDHQDHPQEDEHGDA